MKRLILLIMIIIISVSAVACNKPKSTLMPTLEPGTTLSPTLKPNEAPKGDNGFYTSSQGCNYGDIMQGINLKNITVTKGTNGEYTIDISFVNGSSKLGIAEKAIKGIPRYFLSNSQTPQRMILAIEGINYWDYTQYTNDAQKPFINGIFKQMPVDSSTTYLFIQTKDDYTYKPVNSDGKISIILKPKTVNEDVKQYVTVNAFSQYQENKIKDADLLPVLCNDYASVLLISKGYNTKKEAEDYMTSIKSKFGNIVDNSSYSIISLKGNDLPIYDDSIDIKALQDFKVIKKGGSPTSQTLFYADARVLCWDANGENALFAKPKKGENSLFVDELWLGNKDGVRKKITGKAIQSIISAQFSRSGRYIAMIEQMDDAKVLYILDTTNDNLINTSEEGFGYFCSGYTWDAEKDIIYALTGESAYQLRKYNLSTNEKVVIDEKPCSNSRLELRNGKLAFLWDVADSKKVTTLELANPKRVPIINADDFAMSPDGNWVAASVNSGQDSDVKTNLSIIKIGEEKIKTITNDREVINYFWSKNGQNLFFVTVNNEDSTYPYVLNEYSLTQDKYTELLSMTNNNLYLSNTDNELLLVTKYDKKGDIYPVTYIIDIK